MSLERSYPANEIPAWAPAISCSHEMDPGIGLDVDYRVMADLMVEEGINPSALKDLWIHYTKNPFWLGKEISVRAHAGIFIPNEIVSTPIKSQTKRYVFDEIPTLNPNDIGSMSFILIDIRTSMISYIPGAYFDPSRLCTTTIHELLHFAEYIRDKDAAATYSRYGSQAEEERTVTQKAFEYSELSKYESIVMAAFN